MQQRVPASAAYFFYENYVLGSARIHAGWCGNCNDGRGKSREPPGDENGRWHGPFATRQDALRLALATRAKDVRNALCCIRDNGEA